MTNFHLTSVFKSIVTEKRAGGRKFPSEHFQRKFNKSFPFSVHPASKQRSEGEKVRVGDDLILVSVATERYLVSSLEFLLNLKILIFHYSAHNQRK